jgi:hypothetical protein
MKQVYIDNSKRLVIVNGKRIPRLLLRIIQGAIGKSYVVKRYRGGRIVVTRFPDMSGIVASAKQRVRRALFREAVVYAKWIIADAERKKVFQKSLPRRKQRKVYQAAIQLYMRMQGDKQWLRKQLAVQAVVRAQERNRQGAIGKEQLVMGNKRLAMSNRQRAERMVKVEGAILWGRAQSERDEGKIKWKVRKRELIERGISVATEMGNM